MSTTTEIQKGTVETLRHLPALTEPGSSLEMQLFFLFLRKRNKFSKFSLVSLIHLPLSLLSSKLLSLLQCIDLRPTECLIGLSVMETQEYYTFAFKIPERISTQTLQI